MVLYGLAPSQTRGKHSLDLVKLATYRAASNPLSLSVTPSTEKTPALIAVADISKSLSVLKVVPPDDSTPDYQLCEVSRHFATVWSTAVAATVEHEWLLADSEGNLLALRHNRDAIHDPSWRRMEVIGEFRLGQVVNKIIPVSSKPGPSDVPEIQSLGENPKADANLAVEATPRTGSLVTPRAFVATIEGAIFMFATINQAYVNVLLLLQTSLATRIQAPGYMPWAKYRAWQTAVTEKDEPFRFVDGEMLEQGLLALSDAELESVLEEAGLRDTKLNVTVEEVRAWGEELRRLY